MLIGSRLWSSSSVKAAHATAWDEGRVEDAITRLLAIGEEFVFGLLIELTERRLPPGHLVSTIWESHIDRETDTWNQRIGSWKQLHEIEVASGFPDNQRLQGFIQARNSIVHGLGALTRKQTKTRSIRQKTLAKLKAAGIDVSGDHLVLAESHVESCAEVVKSLVTWLDAVAGVRMAAA